MVYLRMSALFPVLPPGSLLMAPMRPDSAVPACCLSFGGCCR